MQPVSANYVDAAQGLALRADPPRVGSKQEAATEDVAALMRLLARAHEALTGAGIPAEGALLARLARLIEERNQLRVQLYEAAK